MRKKERSDRKERNLEGQILISQERYGGRT